MHTTRSIIAVSLLIVSFGIILAVIGSAYAQTYTTSTNSSANTTKAGNQTNNTTAGGGMASKIPVIGPALNKVPGLNKIPGLGGK